MIKKEKANENNLILNGILFCLRCEKRGHEANECRTVMCEYCKKIGNPRGYFGHKEENCFVLNGTMMVPWTSGKQMFSKK